MQVSPNDTSVKSEKNMEQCIADCFASFSASTKCLSHCLEKGGKHAEKAHIQLMIECADMCKMSMSLMLSNSQFAFEHCQLCAKVCELCAESCAAHAHGNKVMEDCVNACKKCAESCRSMAH